MGQDLHHFHRGDERSQVLPDEVVIQFITGKGHLQAAHPDGESQALGTQ